MEARQLIVTNVDPSRARAMPYLSVLLLAALCYLALGAVLPALPAIVLRQLHGSPAELGLAVGAPSLAAVVFRPLGGWAADAVGARRVVMAGAVVMSAAALLALWPGPAAWLIATRLIVGAGEGAMMSASVASLLFLAPPDRRGRALGHIGLANYLGLAVGPIAGWPLYAHGASALWMGAALVPALAVPIAAVTPQARADAGGRSGSVVVTEALGAGIRLALVNVGYAAVLSFGMLTLESRHAGLARAVVPVYAATIIVVRALGSSIPDRIGARPALLLSAATSAAGLLAFAMAPSSVLALAAVALAGTGQAVAVPALGLLALERVPPRRRGAAGGTFFAFFDIGVGAGGPALGAVAGLGGPAAAVEVAGLVVAAAGVTGGRRLHGRAT